MTIIFLMNMGEENPPAAATPQQQRSHFFRDKSVVLVISGLLTNEDLTKLSSTFNFA